MKKTVCCVYVLEATVSFRKELGSAMFGATFKLATGVGVPLFLEHRNMSL